MWKKEINAYAIPFVISKLLFFCIILSSFDSLLLSFHLSSSDSSDYCYVFIFFFRFLSRSWYFILFWATSTIDRNCSPFKYDWDKAKKAKNKVFSRMKSKRTEEPRAPFLLLSFFFVWFVRITKLFAKKETTTIDSKKNAMEKSNDASKSLCRSTEPKRVDDDDNGRPIEHNNGLRWANIIVPLMAWLQCTRVKIHLNEKPTQANKRRQRFRWCVR